MPIFFHEIKRNRLALLVWSVVLAFMLGVTIIIYPEMQSQMGEMNEAFSQMGSFSEAFGMTELNFGEFMGYFGVEFGNTIGFGGAFFAAVLGISVLAKEEKDRTAEFLLTQPISRARVLTEKLLSVIAQILALDLVVVAVTVIGVLAINADANAAKLALIFLANIVLQIEIAAICFGISAFIRGGGIAIGIGLVVMLYFLNIIANLTENAEFLKYVTPYGYTDSAYIINNSAIDVRCMIVGAVLTVLGILAAYLRYTKKDIA